MGDTATAAYMVHGFSYASAIPNESKQGNPMHVLGESISFGRYMNESISWDRWSSFPHKKYVEEAERYSQPGSVAQKKAFFEAHYKKIAAQKAAALLEQENAAKREAEKDADLYPQDQQRVLIINNHAELAVDHEKVEEVMVQDSNVDDGVVSCNEPDFVDVEEIGKDEPSVVITEDEATVRRKSINKFDDNIEKTTEDEATVRRKSINKFDDNIENQERVSVSENSGIPQIERPLLKSFVASEDISPVTSKKRSSISSLKSSIQRKTWRIPAPPVEPFTPRVDKENNVPESAKKSNVDTTTENRRFSPKSLRALMSLITAKEHAVDKEPTSVSKKSGTSLIARISSRPPKDCSTPMKTPLVTAGKGFAKHPAATPQSVNKRMNTPTDPSMHGNKTTAPKWQIFSSVSKTLSGYRKNIQSPTATTPFILRTEERAAKRKQKLEEKFNANESQKVQTPQRTLKEKAGSGIRKLSNSFCFKARPLPDFYKEREIPKTLIKKTPAISQSQPTVLTRNGSKKKQGTISMPPPPPPPTSLTRNGSSRNLSSKKSSQNIAKSLTTSLPEPNRLENTSPNIVL